MATLAAPIYDSVSSVNQHLFRSIVTSDYENVQRLLSGSPKPDLEFRYQPNLPKSGNETESGDKFQGTALQLACVLNASTLSDYIDVEAVFGEGSALGNKVDIARALLDAGAKVDALLSSEVCPGFSMESGGTVLHVASGGYFYSCDPAMATLLIDKAGDPQCLANFVEHGLTTVQTADRLKYLVDIADSKNNTALHHASDFHGNPLVVDLLLSNGAACVAKNEYGQIPRDIAVLAACFEKGPSSKRIAMHALQEADLTSINEPLEVLDPSWSNRTCLHMLSNQGRGDDIKWLLDRGALTTIPDGTGMTAWDLCCQRKDNQTLFDGVAAFIEKEVEREDTDAFRVSEGDPFRSGQWFYSEQNNVFITCAWIRKIMKEHKSISTSEVFRFMGESFLRRQEAEAHLAFREPSCHFETLKSAELEPESPDMRLASIVMPYFSSTTLDNLGQRRSEYTAFFTADMKYTIRNAKTERLLGEFQPITLDEYCNPVLSERDLQNRNNDQVVARYTRKQAPGPERVVTVRQAWIWQLGATVITTGGHIDSDDQFDTIISFIEAPGDNDPRDLKAMNLHMGMCLARMIDSLDRPTMAGLDEPIFNIFEKSIMEVSQQVSIYLKDNEVANMSLEKERNFFHEIGDIREELSMIQSVLFQQEEVWKEFVSQAWPEHWKDDKLVIPTDDSYYQKKPEFWRRVARPQGQFNKFRRRLHKIDEDAERVEQVITLKLDLNVKHLSIREAHSTAIMSAAIFGFTLITIIFTPLSFAIALLALPIDMFEGHQIDARRSTSAGMYTVNYVGKWITTVELVAVPLTFLAMWLAVDIGLMHGRYTKELKQYLATLWQRFRLRLKQPGSMSSDVATKKDSSNSDRDASCSSSQSHQENEKHFSRFGRLLRRSKASHDQQGV